MKSIYDEWDFFKRLLDMLEQQLGTNTEILLHDLTKDYNHTIVDIRNGHITNRKIGDCGSNLGLRVLSGKVKDEMCIRDRSNTQCMCALEQPMKVLVSRRRKEAGYSAVSIGGQATSRRKASASAFTWPGKSLEKMTDISK